MMDFLGGIIIFGLMMLTINLGSDLSFAHEEYRRNQMIFTVACESKGGKMIDDNTCTLPEGVPCVESFRYRTHNNGFIGVCRR